MRRAFAGLTVAVGAICGVWAAVAQTLDAPSPVPPDVASRLPRYCRFTLDLDGEAHPHAALFAKTKDGDTTCPFAPDRTSAVTVFSGKGTGACDASRFPDVKVSAIEELDGRTARRMMRCATDPWTPRPEGGPPGPTRTRGRAWLLTLDETKQPLADFPAFEGQVFADRLGAPFVVVAVADHYYGKSPRDSDFAYKCIEMQPGVEVDALTFLRQAGPPFPDSVTEKEATGRDCGELVRERAGEHAATSGAAMPAASVESNPAFSLWLWPTKQTPKGPALAALLRDALLRDGVRTAKSGSDRLFAVDHEIVSRTRDDGYLGFSDGPELATVELRTLTAGVCAALFDLAVEAKLDIRTMQTDALILLPRGVTADAPDTEVADAADLCAMLRPGFEEWRDATPRLPVDLNDVDGRKTGFVTFSSKSES